MCAVETERAQGPGPVLPDALVDDARRSAAAGIAAIRTERDAALERAARAGDELGAGRAMIHSLERHLAETSARVERLEGELGEARAATRAAEAEGRAATDARVEQAARATELQAALDAERVGRNEEQLAAEARLAETRGDTVQREDGVGARRRSRRPARLALGGAHCRTRRCTHRVV